MNSSDSGRSLAGMVGASWGAVGFSLILLDAINRLARIALESFATPLSPMQWLILLVIVVVMAYSEGYRGFQKSFSPRTAARVRYLWLHPEPLGVLLAPIFCMGFFRATRRPLQIAWIGTGFIILLVLALHGAPQPWRGLVDAGVVVGLSWGLVSFWVCLWREFSGADTGISPAVPTASSL